MKANRQTARECYCGQQVTGMVFGKIRTLPTVYAHDADGCTGRRAVCPNCDQYQHDGDCLNECVKRGFAPLTCAECGEYAPCSVERNRGAYRADVAALHSARQDGGR